MPQFRVRVPATTANLGSGFDCVGIAFDWYDELELDLTGEGVRIEVSGEGAGAVPRDESHLVVQSLLVGLEEWGGRRPAGLHLRATNAIPHSRGLGSSAAAIVAGLAFGWAISRTEPLDLDELCRVSSRLEGHPDNAGAAVRGGAVLGIGPRDASTVVPLHLHPDLGVRVWVPDFEVPTAGARSVLPEVVPRGDAVEQAICATALPIALERRADLLLAATEDRLHQRYRAELMQPSYDLMMALRERGVAATISGAGPTVFAIGTSGQLAAADACPADGFARHAPRFGDGVSLERG